MACETLWLGDKGSIARVEKVQSYSAHSIQVGKAGLGHPFGRCFEREWQSVGMQPVAFSMQKKLRRNTNDMLTPEQRRTKPSLGAMQDVLCIQLLTAACSHKTHTSQMNQFMKFCPTIRFALGDEEAVVSWIFHARETLQTQEHTGNETRNIEMVSRSAVATWNSRY